MGGMGRLGGLEKEWDNDIFKFIKIPAYRLFYKRGFVDFANC